MTKLIAPIALTVAALLTACEPIDTSALSEIEKTVADARQTVELANERGADVRQTLEDPVGALQAMAGAQLARTKTDQPGVFVLTDMTTGCQFLATYGADSNTPSSIAPRVEPVEGEAPRQRCVSVAGLSEAGAMASGW